MKKLLLCFFSLSFLVAPSFGVQEYYELSRSVRSLGMGGAFFGLSDDEYALFSNPAGLSLRRTGSELMARINGQVSSDAISGLKDFTSLSGSGIQRTLNRLEKYQGQPLYGNAGILPYYVSKNLAVGLLIIDTKSNFNISKASSEITVANSTEVADLTVINDSGIVVGYAQSVAVPELHLGGNLKGLFRAGGRKSYSAAEYIKDQLIDFDPKQLGGNGIGIDLDLGATYEIKNLPFGLFSRASFVFSNLLASDFNISRNYGAVPKLVRTVNLGWYTVFDGFAFVDNLHALVDISNISIGGENNSELGSRTGPFLKKLHLGVELPIGLFSLRAGLNQGYLTAGFGLNLNGIRLDAATYGEENGETTKLQSRRYAVTVALGLGSPPASPISAILDEKKVGPIPVQKPIQLTPEEASTSKDDTPKKKAVETETNETQR